MTESISYCVTVSSEEKEIKRLLPYLLDNIQDQDEVVVLCDSAKAPFDVANYLVELSNKDLITLRLDGSFDGHFANWKNKLFEIASGDYICQLDADEMPTDDFMKGVHYLLHNYWDVELFFFPRENYVEGITPEHIAKWGWRVDEKQRINYPDFQGRMYKNKPEIKWENKVHERIVGNKRHAVLPEEYALQHYKTIDKQEKQNAYYDTL